MFNNSKYTKYYHQITSRAQERASTRKEAKELFGYPERHHILPEAMGGPTVKENLVFLTAREHFICHWLLTKMTSGTDKANMKYALNGMKRKNKYQERYETPITSRVYARIKEEVAKIHSEFMTGRTAWNKGLKLEGEQYKGGRKNKGRTKTQEEIDKRLKKIIGQKRSLKQREHMIKGMTGIKKGPMSEKEKQKRSKTLKDRPKSKESIAKRKETLKQLAAEGTHHSQQEFICEFCGETAKKLSYHRNHGKNCRLSPTYSGPRKYNRRSSK